MSYHPFIFSPHTWLGEGKIQLSSSSNVIKFYTKWEIETAQNGTIKALQTVEIVGIKEKTINHFTFYEISETSFKLILENEHIGKAIGIGLQEEKILQWKFGDGAMVQGTEIYKKQENGSYLVEAKYGADTDFQTLIQALIQIKIP